MRRSSSLILLASLLSTPLYAADAREWLARMVDSTDRQNFRGTFIYERSGNFSTHRIWHLAQGAAPRERLLQLDGLEQEVVLADGRVLCASGSLLEQQAGAQQWAGRKLDVARLEDVYELKAMGDSRVAGRPAVVLLLLPRDANRYARELQLDSATGLPLKSLLLNGQGQLLERLQFTSLEPDASLDSQELQPVTDCRALAKAATTQAVASDWAIGWMPAGFMQVGILQERSATSGQPVQTLMFDDGLARFSIFIEALGDARVSSAHLQVGPTVVVSRPISTANGQFMATVVGEVPLPTAERIALSVGPRTAGEQQP
ncbi:MucB/RseB C-terminal domain-containing protein [Pseudomonas sp. N040]|uniref:MucB/RseB C-terminal domain-containing protein n=1 Tax=Pseudomonas sp. N040 TaxID=2785325 RepID=UPI0018A2978C|nr:MucB/RseB C-terminal domain-containing protein [Pseudomonas sp. N040]MBF7731636.1 MucB/RseB C-terminal domain-containing protein [Pseudomonas sp. N040]MBW7015280.1 MucB/RseB C-terminal domain-containing protein [Pseudomonas sp. N040]